MNNTPAKLESVHNLLGLFNIDPTIKMMWQHVEEGLKLFEFEEEKESIREALKNSLSVEAVIPIAAEVYAQCLSEEEVQALIAFYTTPTGRTILKKMPSISMAIISKGQAQAKKCMDEALQKYVNHA
jgi:uncharacterized protein